MVINRLNDIFKLMETAFKPCNNMYCSETAVIIIVFGFETFLVIAIRTCSSSSSAPLLATFNNLNILPRGVSREKEREKERGQERMRERRGEREGERERRRRIAFFLERGTLFAVGEDQRGVGLVW